MNCTSAQLGKYSTPRRLIPQQEPLHYVTSETYIFITISKTKLNLELTLTTVPCIVHKRHKAVYNVAYIAAYIELRLNSKRSILTDV